MYLIHLLALNVVEKVLSPGQDTFWHPTAAFVLTCALTIAGAYFLGVTIERPFIAAGKKLSFSLQLRKSRPALQTATAAV
jgi:peptidoglycan/LPS O-acetylase OafA/YrhL